MPNLFRWYPFKITKFYPLKVRHHIIGRVKETKLLFPLIGRYEGPSQFGRYYDYGVWYPFKVELTKLDGEVVIKYGRRGLLVFRNAKEKWCRFWGIKYDY